MHRWGIDGTEEYRDDAQWGGVTYGDRRDGPHAGKGPRNFERSADRIRDEVCEALARHPEIDASEIEVQIENGEVTLRGTVADREQKWRAEDVVAGVYGVRDVYNRLRVATAIVPAGVHPDAHRVPVAGHTTHRR